MLKSALGSVRLIAAGLVLVFALAGLAYAEGSMLPFKLKPLFLDTVLVDHGKPNAAIVVPDDAAYQGLAQQVQKAINAATGVNLPIRKASEIANSFGQLLAGAPDKNLILIAGPNCNNVVTQLSHSGYCTVETDYPGAGGSIVRTIHNPWGNGTNAILLGASDLIDVAQAVDRFISRISKGDTLTIPRQMDIVLPPKAAKEAADPTDAEIAAELEKQTQNLKDGQQSGFFGPITQAGYNYARTGKEGQAKLYRALCFKAEELRLSSPDPNNWAGSTDFVFGGLVDTWDNVEESPSLTDSDRERITAMVLHYANIYAHYGTTKGMEVQTLRNNHNTFTCIGVLKAGIYFSKYYDLPDAQDWIKLGDLCFAPETKSFKTQEDCAGYGWINTRHVCNYCYVRQDFNWFTSGKADQAGDLWIMTTDNLGHQVTFGDVGGFTGNGQYALWNTLVDVERSSRYAWAIRKIGDPADRNKSFQGVEPIEPTDLLGVQCRVTEPMFYTQWNGKGKYQGTVPQERTFDKISMRDSFDAQRPYLLLDGINGAYHGHQDGNSILRLTDQNRIWLVDCDYIKSLPRYHNSMLVMRNGESGKMPTFAERELAVDLGKTGFTSTTLHNYGGTDWRRNILWDKKGVFVFLDEIIAQENNDFSARCVWQTLGKPKLSGNLFQVSQKGPTFSILNLDGARVRFSDDRELGSNWNGYEFADPVVHTVQQVQTRKLNAGERICFINVLSTSKNGSAPKAERAGESSALVGAGKDQALVGIRSDEGEIVPGVATDAKIYWISASRIALGQASNLSLNGKPIFSSPAPVSFEVQSNREATVVAEAAMQISVLADPKYVRLDGRAISTSPANGLTVIELPAGRHSLAGLSVPSQFSISLPKAVPAPAQAQAVPSGARKLVEAAAPQPGARILSLAADSTGVYAGRADGKVNALFGTKDWTYNAGEPVTALWLGKLAKNDPARIAVGTGKGKIVVMDETGGKMWDRQLPFYKVDAKVDYFMSADLTGDGNRALIAGSDNWRHWAFDSAGKQLWSYESVRGSTAGTAIDLDGDGKEEPIVGTEYNQLHALNPDGTARWHVIKVGGPRLNSVLSCKLADDKPGVIFGGAEGTAYAYDASGQQVWNYSTGDEITCMELADLGADGLTIIAGSRSFSLTAIKRDGKRLWRTDVGEPILSMAIADLNGDGKVEICVGTEDGHVIAVDQTGSVLASWSTTGPIHNLATLPGSPTRLAVACDDGKLVLLKME